MWDVAVLKLKFRVQRISNISESLRLRTLLTIIQLWISVVAVLSRKVRVRNMKFWVLNTKFRVQNMNFQVLSMKSRVRNMKFQVLMAETEVKSSKFHVQIPKFWVLSFKLADRRLIFPVVNSWVYTCYPIKRLWIIPLASKLRWRCGVTW